MRKIFFFLPDYPGWTSGGHKYHTILFEYFKKKRKEVYSFGNNKFSKYVETNKLLKILFGIYYTISIPRNSIIVQSNTSLLHCFIPVLFNKFWKNHYYFLIIHHLVRDEKPSSLRKKLEDYFIKNANKVITVSATTQKRLYDLNLGLKDIEIINPGLDVKISADSYKKTFPDKLKILYIGTIEERKGIVYLIESLRFINGKNFELNIIGKVSNSTEYFNSLQEKILKLNLKDKVNFTGKVSEEELQNHFMNSSIFVFPSLWEGYGMVVAEAMAYGLPVVATDIPALKELIEDNVTGFLVKTKNPEQISEKINLLISDRKLMEKISDSAFKKSELFLKWDEVSERFFKITVEIN